MNKYLAMLVALVVTMFTANAFAFTPPPAPDHGFYVYDGTGKLTATQISALNHKIDRISQATKNELGIAFLQSLDGADISDAANATFRNWGIGKHGLDNGVLIMLSLKEHKSRIETGKGVGGEITDIQAKQILDGMRPSLRNGDFFAAFNQALDQTSSLLDSRANAQQRLTPMVNPTQAQQDAANRLAQQQGVQQPYQPNAQTNTPAPQQSSGGHGFLIFLGILAGLGVISFLLWLAFRNRDDEDSYSVRSYTPPSYDPPPAPRYTPPAPVHHTHHTTTSHVSARPSVPLTPSYTPPPAPAYVAPAPTPVPVEDNSDAIAAAAAAASAAALLAEEREEERRRERREREEREEERRAERRREEESSSSSSSSSFDWGSSSSGGSDSGGGFGGGDSGGGGASSDW